MRVEPLWRPLMRCFHGSDRSRLFEVFEGRQVGWGGLASRALEAGWEEAWRRGEAMALEAALEAKVEADLDSSWVASGKSGRKLRATWV